MDFNQTKAIGFIIEDEGPEINVSADEPGGASKFGVSVVALSGYFHLKGQITAATIADVKALTEETATDVYAEKFAKPLRFAELPSGIDYRMLDAAASLGATGACLVAQMSMAMWPVTGVMDDATIAALKEENPEALLLALDAAWLVWKHGMTIDGWTRYGHGWTNRIIKVRDRVIPMIGATS